MKVVAFIAALPADLPGKLRELADKVERGEVTQMAIAYADRGSYDFLFPSSLHDSVVLAAMLQQQALDNMRR